MKLQINGMRVLLALVGVFGLLFGWLASLYYAVTVQRAIMPRLEERDVELFEEEVGPQWFDNWGARFLRARVVGAGVGLLSSDSQPGSERIDADVIAALARLPYLRTLDVWDDMSDEELSLIARLGRLRKVFIHCEFTAAGLSRLASLPQLELLNLSCYQINDDKIAALASFPALKRLRMRGVTCNNELISLHKLSHIEELDLSLCDVIFDPPHRNGESHLARWLGPGMNLRTLYLEHWSLGEADIHAIASQKHLELLDLCGCDVDPRFLQHLRPLHNLRGLGIPIWEIDDETISRAAQFLEFAGRLA